MQVTATPAEITIAVSMRGPRSYGHEETGATFDSANDAVMFARQVIASRPGGAIKGDIWISLGR